MLSISTNRPVGRSLIMVLTVTAIFLSACGGGKSGTTQGPQENAPELTFAVPPSLTNQPLPQQPGIQNVATITAATSNGTGKPCAYIEDKDGDHFRNGYKITKLLVSAVATWSCIGDLLIDVSNFVDHDGSIHATDNDLASDSYNPEDPTHYSVIDDSDSQTTVRLYYAYDRNSPPQDGEAPQFYISWNESADDELQGRIVVDAQNINKDNRKAEDPIMLRMDFHYTAAEKTVDMFLRFDDGNHWAEGFRIHLLKDMNANPLQNVYLARGLIEMKAQFLPVDTITEVPVVRLYTVANKLGDGAAIADIQDMSLPLKISGGLIDNHLGNYLFSRHDTYFFDDQSNWDWINKTVSMAEYRGGRNTPQSGGTWIPLDPSLDMIVDELALDADYFTGTKCVKYADNCTQLINAVFENSLKDTQEKNQGADPGDWRSDAMANAVFLESVYPNGADWNGAFDFVFIPTN